MSCLCLYVPSDTWSHRKLLSVPINVLSGALAADFEMNATTILRVLFIFVSLHLLLPAEGAGDSSEEDGGSTKGTPPVDNPQGGSGGGGNNPEPKPMPPQQSRNSPPSSTGSLGSPGSPGLPGHAQPRRLAGGLLNTLGQLAPRPRPPRPGGGHRPHRPPQRPPQCPPGERPHRCKNCKERVCGEKKLLERRQCNCTGEWACICKGISCRNSDGKCQRKVKHLKPRGPE